MSLLGERPMKTKTPAGVSSPKRELRIFTVEEGAAEHVGLDHMPHINAFVADWVEDTLAGR